MGGIDSDARRPSRGIILLSGFLFPGMGQLLQRRWLAGLVFGCAFSVFFLLLLVHCFQVIVAFYRLGLDKGTVNDTPSISHIVSLLVACLAVYVTNVGDVYLAYRRAARRSAVRRHFSPEIAELLEEE
jgi:hypothetical protein